MVLGSAALAALPVSLRRAYAQTTVTLGAGKLSVISDGNLHLPVGFLQPPNMSDTEFAAFLDKNGMTGEFYQPACNVTLWQHGDHTVLFDVGAGDTFMDSTGRLLENLEAAGVSPEDVTDVVISHAHPDHLWGLVDDFDELVFADAIYHMHQTEWNFWSDDATLEKMPEARKVFALGAKSRFAYLEDRSKLFTAGNEIIPGIEVIDTPGHTPGHSAFAIHDGSESIVVVGDALIHPVLAFQPKKWLSGSDHEPELARATRLSLLERLATDQSRLAAYHLPYPGLGHAERDGSAYRFVPS